MAHLFARDSGYGIDNSPTGLTSQFVNSGPHEYNAVFDGNNFGFATTFNGSQTDPAVGNGKYEGSGFQTHFVNGNHEPTAGTVNTIKIDFDGGNTPDVSISQFSVSLVDLFDGDSKFIQQSIFGGSDSLHGSFFDDTLFGYGGDDTIFGGYGDKLNSLRSQQSRSEQLQSSSGLHCRSRKLHARRQRRADWRRWQRHAGWRHGLRPAVRWPR